MVFVIAIVIVVILALALFTLRNFGRPILVTLPFPQRIVEFYDRFEQGVFGALDRRQLPVLGIISVAIWMTEAMRLFFVVKAFGFPDVELGISGAVFVALIGSLLTAVPLSPAGLGIVEAGDRGHVHARLRVPPARGDRDRPAGPRDQRVLGDRLRLDPVCGVGQAAGQGDRAPGRGAVARRLGAARGSGPGPIPRTGYARTAHDPTTPHGRVGAGAPPRSTNGWFLHAPPDSTLQSSRARHAGT